MSRPKISTDLRRKRIKTGERLREIREELGLSQDQLAMRSGVSQPQIAKIESGEKALTTDLLLQFCDVFAAIQVAAVRDRILNIDGAAA